MPDDLSGGKESRNAGFILIAAQRQSTPSKPSKPFEPYEPAEPFSLTTLLHNLRRQPRPLFYLRRSRHLPHE